MKVLMALVEMTDANGDHVYPDMVKEHLTFINDKVVETLHEVSPGFQDGMAHISRTGGGQSVIHNLDEIMAQAAEIEIDREVESFRQSLDNIFGGSEGGET